MTYGMIAKDDAGFDEEDILADPGARPYTQEVEAALHPHTETLQALFAWEPEEATTLNMEEIPVLALVQSKRKSSNYAYRAGIVPFVGNLDIDSRAQIHNWIDVNIPGARANRHLWIGRYLVAHAVTLLLAARMRPESPSVPSLSEGELLRNAWKVQQGPSGDMAEADLDGLDLDLPALKPVDVDAECVRALEHRMFERSATAAEAGFHQWGLDSGEHQDRWDPYGEVPSDWNIGDWWPEDDEELMKDAVSYPYQFVNARRSVKGTITLCPVQNGRHRHLAQ
ncbi:hypothetical protein C8Q80DRAFT_1125392 [Daedaleopsis nitida]|nr:hypothetical protein C8Q80DRAFT_1125392 [Daedaleopsis nitida]